MNKLFTYLRPYKQSHVSTNLLPELETADGTHTQTESMTSNDAAVNTGKFYLNKTLKFFIDLTYTSIVQLN